MKIKSITLLTSLTAMFLISACGQEGPLYLPGKPSEISSTVPKDGTPPPKTEEKKQQPQVN